MDNQWQVPPGVPRPADEDRGRRYAWGAVGAMAGLAVNMAITLLLLVPPMFDDDQTTIEYGGIGVLLLTVAVTLLLLITGGLLCIGRRPRPFGVGLLIGAAVGVICANGVCLVLVAAVG